MKSQTFYFLNKLFEFDQSFRAYSIFINVVIGYKFAAESTRNTIFTRNIRIITADFGRMRKRVSFVPRLGALLTLRAPTKVRCPSKKSIIQFFHSRRTKYTSENIKLTALSFRKLRSQLIRNCSLATRTPDKIFLAEKSKPIITYENTRMHESNIVRYERRLRWTLR